MIIDVTKYVQPPQHAPVSAESANQLLACFNKYLRLNKEESVELVSRFAERRLKRRQFLLQEADICRHYTFVVKGCFRKYYISEKGTEHNLQFIAENDWIMEIDSFHNDKPSRVCIEAMEPSLILQISKPDLYYLFTYNQKYDRNFRVLVENRLVEYENRILQAISSTAEERYLSFAEQYPQLLQRLPGRQIASYLGITPEFFSTLRKRISKAEVAQLP